MNLAMNSASDPTTSTAPAATDQAKAAAAPRIKLLPQGYSIDHPDPALGERLMAEALGVADRDAMEGILRQLVRASVKGGKPDEVNIAFMISMIRSIKPRDAVEAMLVAQMVSVHVMAMRSAYHLAAANDVANQDSAGRELGRLARTFPAAGGCAGARRRIFFTNIRSCWVRCASGRTSRMSGRACRTRTGICVIFIHHPLT